MATNPEWTAEPDSVARIGQEYKPYESRKPVFWLDANCGDGEVFLYLHPTTIKVGIETDEALIEEAREWCNLIVPSIDELDDLFVFDVISSKEDISSYIKKRLVRNGIWILQANSPPFRGDLEKKGLELVNSGNGVYVIANKAFNE